MTIRNKWIIGLFVVCVALFIWIQFIEIPKQTQQQAEQEEMERLQQLDPDIHDFSKVLKYENLYMGNASNISSLFNALPMSEFRDTFAMDSEKFIISLNYIKQTDDISKLEKSIIYDSTAAFALIGNLEVIKYKFSNKTIEVTRDRVNLWLDDDVSTFKNKEKFEESIQSPLKDDINIEQWFQAYTEEVD